MQLPPTAKSNFQEFKTPEHYLCYKHVVTPDDYNEQMYFCFKDEDCVYNNGTVFVPVRCYYGVFGAELHP